MPTVWRTRAVAAIVATLLTLVVSAHAAAQDTIEFDAAVAGGTATVSLTVHENPVQTPWGRTVLAVHGFTETAAMWEPLAEALFEHVATRYRINRVIALDLPGHGNSPIPPLGTLGEGRDFGTLTIYDNVAVVIQAIGFLDTQGIGPRTVVGHSMGGLAVQSAQETLLSSGSSLADLGVTRAVLLAPVPVAEITEWTAAGGELPAEYYRFDNGTYIVLDALGAQFGGGFTTLAGEVIPEAFALDYSTLIGAEPITTAGQLVGAIPELPRPSAQEGAFALRNGTYLTVIGFSEDVLTPAALQPALYQHLLGRNGFGYQEVVAPDAVHAMVITNPAGMLDQLFAPGWLF